jgi:hypothetical protein
MFQDYLELELELLSLKCDPLQVHLSTVSLFDDKQLAVASAARLKTCTSNSGICFCKL